MKQTKNGLANSPLLIIIALLVVVVICGGIYVSKQNNSIISTQETLGGQPDTNKMPTISSVTPNKGRVGTDITIYGKNMIDLQGNQNVAIMNSKFEIGYIGHNVVEKSDDLNSRYLTAKMGPSACRSRLSDAALPCPSSFAIVPGDYSIFIEYSNPSGGARSNRVDFTVTQ